MCTYWLFEPGCTTPVKYVDDFPPKTDSVSQNTWMYSEVDNRWFRNVYSWGWDRWDVEFVPKEYVVMIELLK